LGVVFLYVFCALWCYLHVGHYGHDAQTYMNVGEAMGEAMVKMLKAEQN